MKYILKIEINVVFQGPLTGALLVGLLYRFILKTKPSKAQETNEKRNEEQQEQVCYPFTLLKLSEIFSLLLHPFPLHLSCTLLFPFGPHTLVAGNGRHRGRRTRVWNRGSSQLNFVHYWIYFCKLIFVPWWKGGIGVH